MASKNLDVGVKFTGDPKDFKQASNEAKAAAAKLRKEAVAHSKEMERKFKDVTMSVAKIGAAILVARQAFKLFEQVMNSTQTTSDELAVKIAGIKEVAQTVAASLATMDFSVSLREAKKAAEEYAKVLDDLGDRARSIDIISVQNRDTILTLKAELRDATLSEERRLWVAGEIKRLGEDELNLRKEMATQALEGIVQKTQAKYKIDKASASLITKYVSEYARFSRAEHESLVTAQELDYVLQRFPTLAKYMSKGMGDAADYAKDFKTAQEKAAAAALQVTPELQKYITLFRPINDLTDDQRDAIRNIIVEWYGANRALREYLGTAQKTENKLLAAGVKRGSAAPKHSTEQGITGGGIASAPSLSQLEKMNELMISVTETTRDYQELVSSLEPVFNSLFRAGMEGWEEFGATAKGIMKDMMARVLSLIAAYTFLNILTGGTMSLSGLGSFITNGMGFSVPTTTTTTTKSAGVGNMVLKGRDIVKAGERSGNVMFKNT